ncbi:hypothetical protein AN958_03411 [Leucoagaricus sp. SymC.cos]|nr:hypothetical protein AN958_03411 [Leucoagaricus sp. SymC.cos]
MDNQNQQAKATVTELGQPQLILGTPWLQQTNSNIDWKNRTISLDRRQIYEEICDQISEGYEYCNYACDDNSEDELNVKTNTSQLLAQKYGNKKSDDPRKIVPKDYHQYLDIFSEKKASRFPPDQKWNHKIELLPTFEAKPFPNYKLAPKELEELDKFLDENLLKGYIRPSKLPMALPFFFVSKKDRKL